MEWRTLLLRMRTDSSGSYGVYSTQIRVWNWRNAIKSVLSNYVYGNISRNALVSAITTSYTKSTHTPNVTSCERNALRRRMHHRQRAGPASRSIVSKDQVFLSPNTGLAILDKQIQLSPSGRFDMLRVSWGLRPESSREEALRPTLPHLLWLGQHQPLMLGTWRVPHLPQGKSFPSSR